MLIILLLLSVFRTLHGTPLSSTSPSPLEALDAFPSLDLCDTQVVFGQRSVNDILISCFATIFACTWGAVHPNIPATTDCWWTRFKRQFVTMIYALLAPEFTTLWALRQYLVARKIVDKYNKEIVQCENESAQANDPTKSSLLQSLFQDSPLPPAFPEGKGPQWTLAHGFFFLMGGFMLCENGRPIQTLANGNTAEEHTTIIWNIQNGIIDPPRITEEDIQDRSKGDAISKTFIILQTIWFIAQCVARWSSHLPVTELEVVTLAFAVLNGIIYGLWWEKPQNVGRPMFLEIKKTQVLSESKRSSAEPSALCPHNSDEKDRSMLPHPTPGTNNWLGRKLRQEMERRALSKPWTLIWRIPLRLFQAFLRPLNKMSDDHKMQQGALRVGMFFSAEEPSDDDGIHPTVATITTIGTLFGSVHLICGWFLDFSSRQEMWLWRVSAIVMTVEPLLGGVTVYLDFIHQSFLTRTLAVPLAIGVPLYMFSRVTVITLSLISLRSLPPAALQTIEWTTFIPHL